MLSAVKSQPLIAVCVFVLYSLFLLTLLSIPDLPSLFAALLVVLGIVAAVWLKPTVLPFKLDDRLFLISFLLFPLVSLISFLNWPYSKEAHYRLEDYSLFVLLLPLFFVLKSYRLNIKALIILFSCIAIFSGLESIIQYWHFKSGRGYIFTFDYYMAEIGGRPSGAVNPMRYAGITLVYSTLCVAGIMFFIRRSKRLSAILLLGVVLSCIACLLTQVRGAWLVLPFLAIFYCFYLYQKKRKKALKVLVTLMIILVGVFATNDRIKSRVLVTELQVNSYLTGDSSSSLGARLDMFKAAWVLIKEKPLFGHGLNSYKVKATLIRLSTPGMSREVGMWKNPHNEVLQVMVEKGVLGLISLIVLFAGPAYIFIKGLKRKEEEICYFSMCGLSILIVYAVIGQSVALFEHEVFNHFFILMITLFASQVLSYRDFFDKKYSEEAVVRLG